MNDFSKGSVRKCIIAQAIPLTLAQIVQLLYNIVDRIYIGHLPVEGELALTGVGVTFPIIVLIAAFTGLFGNGAIPVFSIMRGKGDVERAEKIMGNSFALLALSSFCLFFICMAFMRPILFLFGASEASFVYSEQYLGIYLFGTAFSMLATGLNGFINAQGFPKAGMVTMLAGAGINILLDPVFIFLLGMGVRGAALATVISQMVSAIWVLRFLTRGKAPLKLKRRNLPLEKAIVKDIATMGVPVFVMQGSNCMVQAACNSTLQLYGGDLYVGIMTILNSVREVVVLPVSGISSGSQPVLGFNYGAGENHRVKEGIRFLTTLLVIYTALAWLVVISVPELLFRIFSKDMLTITTGAEMLYLYFFGFFFMSFQFAGQSTFQALRKSKKAIFFSMLRKVIIVVPLTFILPAVGLGVKGVFLAEPISNAIGGLICFAVMWKTEYKKL